MESQLNYPLVINKKCHDHNLDCVAVCINKSCNKNRLVCYHCVFFEHSSHSADCIPLGLWKYDTEINNPDGFDIQNTLETTLVRLKDFDNLIHQHFCEFFERIQTARENFLKEGIMYYIGNNLPIWENFSKINGEYVITKKDTENMFKNIEMSVLLEIERLFTKEFKKFNAEGKEKGVNRPVKKSSRRLTSVNDNWSHATSYYDCIGFKTTESDVNLLGVGLYQMDTQKKGLLEISIYKEEIKNEKNIFKETFNLSTLEISFADKVGDLMFSKEIALEREIKYIIVKINLENNPSGHYGKNTNTNTQPFVYFSMKEASSTYKTGNYSDLNTGAFPYFLYNKFEFV